MGSADEKPAQNADKLKGGSQDKNNPSRAGGAVREGEILECFLPTSEAARTGGFGSVAKVSLQPQRGGKTEER